MNTNEANIALVTGASRGIGRGAALALAESGTDVIITYRTGKDEAGRVVEEIRSRGRRAHALQLDVADTAGFADFRDRVHDLLRTEWDRDTFDVLVNNAGSVIMRPFTDITEADFDAMMNVHVKGVFFLTQHLVTLISDGGRVINVSSAITRFTDHGMSVYATAKGAVETLTKFLAKELGARGITVNAVAPGATATDFAGGFARSTEAAGIISGMTTLGRVGQAEDIGEVIAAVASPATAWVTGQRIEASGGMML